ncbi:short-chain dehydrogenase [Skermanella stibiiresistens SB22]|uniref:Short-chain dehydrogenase n=1 Tax=Skermanella stibiiresistens SB22 TaxID=1385369 RepID=W9H4H7_9PROT|nr:SDR family oxidoreductase [Skermanella stibiiresistens]EWY41120.1 short-chain dehydrogenase [Skermanella stibiiresistens SB22]
MVAIKKKTVLITGAGKRIGRAMALDLAAHGWAVAVHYFTSRDDADGVVAEIASAGGRAVAIQGDLGDEADTVRLVPEAVERLGPLTALINNASVFERDEIGTADRTSWDRHIETNLRAPLVLSQAFARQLPDDERGCVVNILDQRVWNLTPHFLSYTLSKAGLWTLTQTLALALAPRIRVNGIGPGPTLRNDRQTEEHFASQWENIPLQRPTSPEEICDGVRFILDSPALTGQMIALDGGEHLGWAQPGRGFVPVE